MPDCWGHPKIQKEAALQELNLREGTSASHSQGTSPSSSRQLHRLPPIYRRLKRRVLSPESPC
eukprot:12937238-Prorocentrum_lima.AAC.1